MGPTGKRRLAFERTKDTEGRQCALLRTLASHEYSVYSVFLKVCTPPLNSLYSVWATLLWTTEIEPTKNIFPELREDDRKFRIQNETDIFLNRVFQYFTLLDTEYILCTK